MTSCGLGLRLSAPQLRSRVSSSGETARNVADDEPGGGVGEAGGVQDVPAAREPKGQDGDHRVAGAGDVPDLRPSLGRHVGVPAVRRHHRHAIATPGNDDDSGVDLGLQSPAGLGEVVVRGQVAAEGRLGIRLVQLDQGEATEAVRVALGVDGDRRPGSPRRRP
jgi:hypothetical protein